MIEPAAIAFVCEGDAERDAFSGTARRLVEGLRALGHDVTPVDVRPHRAWRALEAAFTFSPDRARWRARYRYGEISTATRSLLARARLARIARSPDVILQVGATFTPPHSDALPFALYCDWNMTLSQRYRDECPTATSGLSERGFRANNARQRELYRRAATIFTISERLRRSFVEDYGVPAERVVVAYPGANVDPGVGAIDRPEGPGRVLFVGVEFERKGGPELLAAFRDVRRKVPGATLTIIGPHDLQVSQDGVEVLGHLRKDVPEQRERLLRAFVEADVFCLPSRVDPFPNVVREAMWYGLPCVTSDFFAMPEMVVDGETGFTVPPGDAAALADRLVRLLGDRPLRQRMGAAGRRRVEERFTWSRCAQVLHTHLQAVRDAHRSGVTVSTPASAG